MAAAVIAVVIGVPAASAEQGGQLDGSFGLGGTWVQDFLGREDTAQAVLVQPDGMVVAAGVSEGASADFVVARFNLNGTPDAGFGAGRALTDFPTTIGKRSDSASAVALQPDGKVVAVGSSRVILSSGADDSDVAIARYDADGSLDSGFSGDGMRIVEIDASDEHGVAVALEPDGDILAAGTRNQDFLVLRLSPGGARDGSFAFGAAITDFGGGDVVRALAVQPDGKVVAAGGGGSGRDFAVARYNPDGTLDASFGAGGKILTDFGSTDEARAVTVLSDGKIVVAGRGGGGAPVARYNPDGTLDASFGVSGKAVSGATFSPFAAAFHDDGRIVVAGTGFASATALDFALVRYRADGTVDTTFGAGGTLTTDFDAEWPTGHRSDDAFAVAIGPDGKIVAAGRSDGGTSTGGDFALARYLPGTDGPAADAGGPYAVLEGDGLVLDASASVDPDDPDESLVFEWDLDADGTFGDVAGATPTLPWDSVLALVLGGSFSSGASGQVSVRITDPDGHTSTDSATVTAYARPTDGGEPVRPETGGTVEDDAGTGASLEVPLGALSEPTAFSIAEVPRPVAGWAPSLPPLHWMISPVFHFGPVVGFAPSLPSWLTMPTRHARSAYRGTAAPRAYRRPSGSTNLFERALEASAVGWSDALARIRAQFPFLSSEYVWLVENSPPDVDAGGPYAASVGSGVTLAGSASDADEPFGDSVVSYEWDLDGDGEFDDASGPAPAVASAALPSQAGDYAASLRATDSAGAFGVAQTTLSILRNTPPTVEAGADRFVAEGQTVTLAATFDDLDEADQHTFSVEWGDGSASSDSLDAVHVYADDGAYTVTVTVTDDRGGVGSDTLTVTAENAAPTGSAGPDLAGDEGASVSLTATFNDKGTLDTHTATIDWGDGSPVETAAVAESPFGPPGSTAGADGTASGSHVFDDDGAYTVTVAIADDDGGVFSDTLTVTVANVPPAVDAGPDASEYWGLPVPFSASVSDPSAADTAAGFVASWAFGDGSPPALGLEASHVYAEPGAYDAVAAATDEDGGTGSDTRRVEIRRREATISYTGSAEAAFGFAVLSARVADAVDAATARLAGIDVVFAVGGETLTATTDADGVAVVPDRVALAPGTYTVAVSFAGSGRYLGSRTAATLEVKAMVVAIDVKPGGERNSVGCKAGNGQVPVAILSSADFDATTVDADSVRFGKRGDEALERHRGRDGKAKRHVEDVNGDGRPDLVLHFRLGDTGFSCADVAGGANDATLTATLTGLADGTAIVGEDAVRFVGKGA